MLVPAGRRATPAVQDAVGRPEVQQLDPLAAPRPGSPPEHRGCRESEEARRREDGFPKGHVDIEPARDDPKRHQHERLDLEEDQKEYERERGRAEGLPHPVGEGDIQKAHRSDYACRQPGEQGCAVDNGCQRSVAERSGPMPTIPMGAPTVCSIFVR